MFAMLLVPGPPMSMKMTSPSESEITLHWMPPSKPNGILLGYSLQYRKSEHDSTVMSSNIQHEVYDCSSYTANDVSQSNNVNL